MRSSATARLKRGSEHLVLPTREEPVTVPLSIIDRNGPASGSPENHESIMILEKIAMRSAKLGADVFDYGPVGFLGVGQQEMLVGLLGKSTGEFQQALEAGVVESRACLGREPSHGLLSRILLLGAKWLRDQAIDNTDQLPIGVHQWKGEQPLAAGDRSVSLKQWILPRALKVKRPQAEAVLEPRQLMAGYLIRMDLLSQEGM